MTFPSVKMGMDRYEDVIKVLRILSVRFERLVQSGNRKFTILLAMLQSCPPFLKANGLP